MKTKFKVRIVALTAALLMLLSAFCSFGILSARAGEVSDSENANYVFPEPTPEDERNPDSSYTSLYYFSDYSESEISIYDYITSWSIKVPISNLPKCIIGAIPLRRVDFGPK